MFGTHMNSGTIYTNDPTVAPFPSGVPLLYREEGPPSTGEQLLLYLKMPVVKIFTPTTFPEHRRAVSGQQCCVYLGSIPWVSLE